LLTFEVFSLEKKREKVVDHHHVGRFRNQEGEKGDDEEDVSGRRRDHDGDNDHHVVFLAGNQ